MNTGLTLLSDAELDVLRVRITQMMRAGIAEQRQAVSAQLEAIDIERERRLSPRPA